MSYQPVIGSDSAAALSNTKVDILTSVGAYTELQSLLFSWDEEGKKRKELIEGADKHF